MNMPALREAVFLFSLQMMPYILPRCREAKNTPVLFNDSVSFRMAFTSLYIFSAVWVDITYDATQE